MALVTLVILLSLFAREQWPTPFLGLMAVLVIWTIFWGPEGARLYVLSAFVATAAVVAFAVLVLV